MTTKKRMMRVSALLVIITLMFTLVACGGTPSKNETQAPTEAQAATIAETKAEEPQRDTTEPADPASEESKTLVVYFSATGTTEDVAQQIASVTGADLYEITAAQPYTDDDLNWNDSNSRTTLEQNDKSVRPEIASKPLSLDGYSTIFIGFPIWWGEEPRIMDTFVESYDFDGKTMIPFCTSSSSPIGSSGVNLEANAGSGNWLEGERLSASSDIEGWVNGFDL